MQAKFAYVGLFINLTQRLFISNTITIEYSNLMVLLRQTTVYVYGIWWYNYLIQEVIWVGANPPKLGNVNKYE